jgi:hypothetical protein
MERNLLHVKITRVKLLCCIVLFGMAVTGCDSKTKATPENFTQAINTYFQDRSECLFSDVHFPYSTSDANVSRQMNTLVKAHLLDANYESAVKTTRYTVTATGARFAPRFCYGHRQIAGIDHFTPPQKGPSGFPETRIDYHYDLRDVPVWAHSPEIEAAYPEMTQITTKGGSAQITLAQTLAGWQVPER